MRTLITVSIPVETGNTAIKNNTIPAVVQKFIADHKPEAAYFFADDQGNRSSLFVVDMKDASDIPVMAEPFFLQLNAQVKFRPVMNQEDLAAAMKKISA
jgi:hypothetical protein